AGILCASSPYRRGSAGYCSAAAIRLLLAEFLVEFRNGDPCLHSPPSASVEQAPPCHMWTALIGKRFFLDVLNGLAACGHMSGLFARKPCPLALMKSDCEGPYQCCGLYARGTEQGVLRRRCRPVVHHVEVSPSPNSLFLGLL